MRVRKILSLAAFSATILTLGSAYAGGSDTPYQAPVNYNKTGFYVDVGGGDAAISADDLRGSGGFAAIANLGLQFTKNVGFEVGYSHLTEKHSSDPTVNWAQAAIKGVFPFGPSDRMSVFAKAGYIRLLLSKGRIASTRDQVLAGVGFGYQLTNSMGINLQYQGIAFNDATLSTVTIGLGLKL